MLRIITILIALTAPTVAQVMMKPDESLQEQLLPESFKFEASAVSAKINLFEWNTSISYVLTNNSGMNLYMGIAMGSVSVGSCTRADPRNARGGLQMLPAGAMNYSVDIQAGPPRPAFAPAGARIAGTIVLDECSAPNPGFPTAPVTMSLMIGKNQTSQAMIWYPVSADAAIRQIGQ